MPEPTLSPAPAARTQPCRRQRAWEGLCIFQLTPDKVPGRAGAQPAPAPRRLPAPLFVMVLGKTSAEVRGARQGTVNHGTGTACHGTSSRGEQLTHQPGKRSGYPSVRQLPGLGGG